MLTVTDPMTLWLDVLAPDRIAAAFGPGANVKFSVPAYPGEFFQARVQTVGGALDPATRSLLVRAVVENRERRLRPEMFATVWIESGASQTGISVPDDAVQLLEQKPVVFIARPDRKGGARFEYREVELGARANGQTQILRGVGAGELVVVRGAFAVKAEFARSKMAAG
jgi:cobalt-zinc-cadmium efflux system membrane fusion protein